jgi:diguanylate cyclase (GGDEF)-like protein
MSRQACAPSPISQIHPFPSEDAATGLPIPALFRAQAEKAVATAAREQAPLTLLALDVDGLAGVNENFGRATGDAALRLVGLSLGLSCRRADLPTRLGDDDFLVLAPWATGAAGVIIARRVQETLGRLLVERGCAARSLTVSVGIADLERVDAADLQALQQAATAALVHAKVSSKHGGGVALAPRRTAAAPRMGARRAVALTDAIEMPAQVVDEV